MKPLTVITGILLGTTVSITLSLTAVLVMFAVAGDEQPRVMREWAPLQASLAIFLIMTGICAVSFWLEVKTHRLSWLGQGAMWSGLFMTGWYFWP